MASTKTNGAGLSETTRSKSSPVTPRVAKPSRGVAKSEANAPSPTQNSRVSTDRSSHSASSKPSVAERSPHSANSKPSVAERSPHSANSKPSTERRSPKVPTPTEKTQARVVKGSELQTRLNQIQEELKKANEQILSLEKEKAKALDELSGARKEAEEATKKLEESLGAQKTADVNSEIEIFQTKEEEWKRELETVKKHHAQDSATLRLVTEELEKVKQDLAAANDAKSRAMTQADDASKLADIHAEKVEILSSELTRLKALLDSTREKETLSTNEISVKLSAEIGILQGELNKARSFEAEVKEREAIIKQLNVDLEAAKIGESCARSSAEEWKSKVKELEERLEEVNKLERSASVSLESVMKQLEGSNDRLHEAESEISDLKEKVGSLEMTVRRQKEDLEESENQLGVAKDEISKVGKEAEKLKNELETVKEEKNRALKNERDAASCVQKLLEEKEKLISELESSKEEEEKSKKAMESLASALHEVSTEARELKEKLFSQGDHEYETQIEDLKLVIKATNQKYESMLDEARHETDVLVSAVEQTKKHFESSKADWEIKEANLVNQVKKMEEDVASMGKEMNRLSNSHKRTEEEASAAKKKVAQMENSLKEVEDEVIHLQETLTEAKAESMKLKENMLDKETKLQSIAHENEELRAKEEASLKKIEELSKLLEEALAKKQTEENGELSESEKDYDLLPKVVEFSEENGHRSGEEKSCIVETLDKAPQEDVTNGLKVINTNGKLEEDRDNEEKKEDSPDNGSVEVLFKMWESCKIEKKEALPYKKSEQESPEEEVEEEEDLTKIDESDKASTENIDETGNTLTAEELQDKKKKKKTLFGKVGNLLKKKGPVNQK